MLVVKEAIMPPSTEELIQTIVNNRTTIMFWDRGDIAVEIVRNHRGEHKPIGAAIEKYPPIYINDMTNNWQGEQDIPLATHTEQL